MFLIADEVPFFVIRSRTNASSACDSKQPAEAAACVFRDRKINFADKSFASCLKFNRVLHQRFNYSDDLYVDADDHLFCCNGTIADKSCEERSVFKERPANDDDDIENVILEENLNSMVNYDHASETLYTCECNYWDGYFDPDHKVLVRD